MGAVIHYQAIDERGKEILDELERRSGLGSKQFPEGDRAYYLANENPADLAKWLDEIDQNWKEHVGRLTD